MLFFAYCKCSTNDSYFYQKCVLSFVAIMPMTFCFLPLFLQNTMQNRFSGQNADSPNKVARRHFRLLLFHFFFQILYSKAILKTSKWVKPKVALVTLWKRQGAISVLQLFLIMPSLTLLPFSSPEGAPLNPQGAQWHKVSRLVQKSPPAMVLIYRQGHQCTEKLTCATSFRSLETHSDWNVTPGTLYVIQNLYLE